MVIFKVKNIAILTFLLILISGSLRSQTTKVKGTVIEAFSGQPMPYVTVSFIGSSIATKTNNQGKFEIIGPANAAKVQFKYIGFKPLTISVKPGTEQLLDIHLEEDTQALDEVSITSGKHGRYRNQNNPAVELIRKVIDNKERNQMENFPQLSYRQYDRLQVSLSNLGANYRKKKIFRNYQYLFQTQDSSRIGGELILPIYLQEKLIQKYQHKNPDLEKTILLASKQVKFDTLVIDNQGIATYLERMYEDVNLYDNNILIATTQFLSPIASLAPSFYKFFITDTVKTSPTRLIELSFIPRNPADLLLTGKLYIADDGSYALNKAFITISNKANLNFVRGVELSQEFSQLPNQKYYLRKSDMIVDFGISQQKGRGFTGKRTQVIDQLETRIQNPDSVFAGKKLEVVPGAYNRSDIFWSQNRLEQVSDSTLKIYSNIDSLGQSKPFKRAMTVAGILFNGYYNAGLVEIGPTYTFYSFNSLEGLKLRLGGRTTTAFSTRYFLEGYVGYGFNDERWKGLASVAYSLNNKSIYTYPQSFIRASVQRDTYAPGKELRGNNEDDFISSFRRGVNNRFLYNDFYKLEYIQEFENRFSFNLGFRRWTQRPAMALHYFDGANQTVDAITSSELNLSMRYAPQEKFYQGKRSRVAVNNRFPIFNLRYAAGLKGLLGGQYNYHNLYGTIDKRFYLSQLGITDLKVEGGYIFNKLPYPLLAIHKANQSYAYQINAYNMMNFLEFVSDHYASINIDHGFGGFFLNKIPVLKRLQLREHAALKAVYGGVRDENKTSTFHCCSFKRMRSGRKQRILLARCPM